jgi:hypothetical protein
MIWTWNGPGANNSLQYKLTHHFMKCQTWTGPLEQGKQQKMDEIWNVECEEPV